MAFKSAVWDYFTKSDDSMQCKPCLDGVLQGHYPSNGKKHLESYHPEVFKEVEERDADHHTKVKKRKSEAEENQPNIGWPVETKKPKRTLSSEEPNSRNATLLFVQCPEFRHFVMNYDKAYEIPKSSRGARSVLASEPSTTRNLVEEELLKAKSKVSFTLDIWTAIDSVRAKAELRSTCGKSFIFPATTRWGSHFLISQRILEIWKAVNETWAKRGWPTFMEADVQYLAGFCRLMEPFYSTIIAMQKDIAVTSSRVYGTLKNLLKHCDSLKDDHEDISALAGGLKKELTKRFGHYVDNRATASTFNPHFVVAALLDPSQAYLVDREDESYLTRLLIERMNIVDDRIETSDVESIGDPLDDASFEEQMFRRCREEKRRSSQPQQYSQAGSSEAQRYLQTVIYNDYRKVNPLEFWTGEGSVTFPQLASAALTYLCAPATSAAVERSFSSAGLALAGTKKGTKEVSLNNKLMVHPNRHLL